MAERVEQMLAVPIQVADQVSKMAAEAESFKQECVEVKKQTDKLAALLRQAARASGGLYERPTARITDETNKALNKALLLVSKCSRRHGMLKRVFTITSAAAFRKMGLVLDSCIGDVTWLLNVSGSGGDLGLPPIATNDPMLGLIWEQIARLHTGTPHDKADSATSLVSLARDSDRNAKLIAEEGGIPPLLRLLKDGSATVDAQEAAAKALGTLGKDRERVRQMIHDGIPSALAKVLKDGPIKVQSAVAWALSELLSTDPDSQEHFAQNGIIRSLVGHLAFETVKENSKYMVGLGPGPGPVPKAMSIHSVVTAANTHYVHIRKNTVTVTGMGLPSLSGLNLKGREAEDPSVKATLKAEVAKALWKLAKNNIQTCKSITESKALVCFAILLEKGQGQGPLLYHSAMAVMEIAAVAEQNADLRRTVFKTNSPAAKALVEQLLRIIEAQEDSQIQLLKPCIKAIGCLARTFPARETRLIAPLVKHLDHRDLSVSTEAAVALSKFACKENYLHMEHSKAILDASGAPHLIQLVYFGEGVAQIPALILLCYLALHVGDSEALAKAEALSALEWASKQAALVQHPTLDQLLPDAKTRLDLYQSRPGFRYS